ncbi:protein of unknown function [Myroides marinus]|uniref:DUF4377 domain-containing protein n=1 Tax=Myroides marinus TaxID=703342 RepID=A0A161U4M5_9FLAO|nr:DUF4377 domain-containing protein [Myroides marinus]KZE80246.1 hypothetical protein AV926_10300 [Myroides marinus]SEI68598.1 protein of unknown function [Myroides marinus]
MKKILLLAAVVGFAFTSCKKDGDQNATAPATETTEQAVTPEEAPAETAPEAKEELGNVTYTIASKLVDCTGVAPMKCMQIKEDGDKDWTLMYTSIDGFNYEEGYEYVVEVKREKLENVPADASSIKYTLVKEISKTKK